MNAKHLGDSYDIVKRFWAERLALVGPLFAHPRFVPQELRSDFEAMVGMRVLAPQDRPSTPFGIFLDPDTGIPLPAARSQTVTRAHAPVAFIQSEYDRLQPSYLVCFDQSHDRAAALSSADQRAHKRAALRELQLQSFYYVSHASFLFVSKSADTLREMHTRILHSGIPAARLDGIGVLP